jgi:protein phosphatase
VEIEIPADALVLLVGPSGSGKSTFALRHFARTAVVSSDFCRALVSDDETNMDATAAAFRILHAIVRERLREGLLTVVDATNVRADKRLRLLKMARDRARPAVAIAFDLPDATYVERNRVRPDRSIPPAAVRRQIREMRAGMERLATEGFERIYRLDSPEGVDGAFINIGSDA